MRRFADEPARGFARSRDRRFRDACSSVGQIARPESICLGVVCFGETSDRRVARNSSKDVRATSRSTLWHALIADVEGARRARGPRRRRDRASKRHLPDIPVAHAGRSRDTKRHCSLTDSAERASRPTHPTFQDCVESSSRARNSDFFFVLSTRQDNAELAIILL